MSSFGLFALLCRLLKYEEGQFYQTHTDYIDFQIDRPSGVRALTFYIYLNDVEEGGGTNFPKLDRKDSKFAVQPKKGVSDDLLYFPNMQYLRVLSFLILRSWLFSSVPPCGLRCCLKIHTRKIDEQIIKLFPSLKA